MRYAERHDAGKHSVYSPKPEHAMETLLQILERIVARAGLEVEFVDVATAQDEIKFSVLINGKEF